MLTLGPRQPSLLELFSSRATVHAPGSIIRKAVVNTFHLKLRVASDAHGGLEINVHGTRDVLSGASLTEKGVESIVSSSNGLVTWHLAIRLDAVLEAVEFPAAVSGLDTGLAHMDRDTF